VSATDFVATIHALERFEQRFPELAKTMSDAGQAELMRGEVMDALDAGRHGMVPPVELSARAVERWQHRRPGGYVAWTKDKSRGYVLQECPEEGLIVLTVLVGEDRARAQNRRLRR
jgi:hypothetical protein